MKDVVMAEEWRTVQLFISENGVCEVQVDSNNVKSVKCNCKGSMTAGRCAHIKHVRKIMDENNGNYTISVPEGIDDADAIAAMADATAFRNFVIKYGKVETL